MLVALAGCLSVPEEDEPMCRSTSDCNRGAGEICDEGVCWGNPPAVSLSALLSPPSERTDLAPRELPQFVIHPDGWFDAQALDATVQLALRVVEFCPPPMTCDRATLAATVTVSRSSRFRGGPGFRTIADAAAGATGFAIPVPRTGAGDDAYTIMVVPAGGLTNSQGRAPAERLPPLRLRTQVTSSSVMAVELGGLDLPVVRGTLLDSAGRGLANYRVAALGRWDAGATAVEVSSVDFTDATGEYAITLSDDLFEAVELVARPVMPSASPTIRIAGIAGNSSSSGNDVVLPSDLGAAAPFPLRIAGFALSGGDTNVGGALVSVTGRVELPGSPNVSFTVSDEETTNAAGEVTLQLLNGAALTGAYRLAVTPPIRSSLSAIFDRRLAGAESPVRLPQRVQVRGRVVDFDGQPVAGASVTARPSLRFLWALDTGPQSFVAAIPVASDVTPPTGEFSLWVDDNVASVDGFYDLVVESPAGARAPAYSYATAYVRTEIAIASSRAADGLELSEITLPDPAFVRGRITTPTGDGVEGAELKLYVESPASLALCTEVAHAPRSCPIPAPVQGQGTSDDDGTVRLALPR